jgi:ferritin-like metal-binding protein YciE
MSEAAHKTIQYLDDARRSEQALARVLQAQIAVTPRGAFRKALEAHLRQTGEHADRLHGRLSELGAGDGAFGLGLDLGLGLGLLESVLAQAQALALIPVDLVRRSGGEEKVLKNAKDACAAEALEIATYTALERLAQAVGDTRTAELAASIRADEQKMLDRLLKEIPRLTDAVAGAELDDHPTYEISEIGAVDAARAAGRAITDTASRTSAGVKRTARQARKVPGVAQAEGQIKGAIASEGDLPIAGYGKLTASEIAEKLSELSQIDLAKVDAYERRHDARSTVLSRITSLRGQEPWPGYDELTVAEIAEVIQHSDDSRVRRVRSYERSHKARAGVIAATDRELSSV